GSARLQALPDCCVEHIEPLTGCRADNTNIYTVRRVIRFTPDPATRRMPLRAAVPFGGHDERGMVLRECLSQRQILPLLPGRHVVRGTPDDQVGAVPLLLPQFVGRPTDAGRESVPAGGVDQLD